MHDWPLHVEQAMAGARLRSVYQPIIDLSRRTVVGYEALTRFDAIDGQVYGPDVWFAEASRVGLGAELDAATLACALQGRADLPRNCFMSVNVEPESLLDPRVAEIFAVHGNLAGVVIEITEHRAWNWAALHPIVNRLRSAGAMFAVDDAGAGHSGLQQMLELRPSILKLDRSLIEGIDDDEAKRALVEMLGLFANRVDAWILAEGVETCEEARALVSMAVPLAQGYYFGRPADRWAPLDPGAVRDLIRFIDAEGNNLYPLVDPVTPLAERQPRSNVWGSGTGRWLPIVDDDNRPVGLLTPESAMSNELVKGLVANASSSPQEVSHRLSTAVTDPAIPVIVTDDGGRYVGIVTTRRLLGALGSVATD